MITVIAASVLTSAFTVAAIVLVARFYVQRQLKRTARVQAAA